jgi:hypothetical protein
LRVFGYVEGQNAVIEGRWYGDQVERLPGLAAELIRLEIENRLPAMLTGRRDSVEAGGLVAYGADLGGRGLCGS